MNSVHYVLDFDRTLFNDDMLIASLMKEFIAQGATEEGMLHAYAKIAVQNELWSPWKWAEYTFGHVSESIRSHIDFLHKQTSSMVYADVRPFLERIGRSTKSILSYGDPQTQNEKIVHSGIAHYFSDITITQDPQKTSDFLRYSDAEHIIFVDDRGPVIDAVKGAHPRVTCIRIMRPGSAYNHESSLRADRVVSSLADLNEVR